MSSSRSVHALSRPSTPLLLGASLLAALLVLAVALAGTSQAAKKGASGKPKVRKISLLYVVDASNGSLKPAGRKGAYTLTLGGLAPDAVWFSDRPARRSGAFEARGIADGWQGFGFAADPPNAALTYSDPKLGPDRTAILKLSRPRFAAGKLSFSARPVGAKGAGPNLALHAKSADKVAASRFTDAALFIDNADGLTFGSCLLEPFTVCEGFDFQGGNLFEKIDLRGAKINNSALQGNRWNNAELEGVNFSDTYMAGDSFVGANLKNAVLEGGIEWMETNLSGANLENAKMAGAQLFMSTLNKTNLSGADLSGIELQDGKLEEADLANANLSGANLYGSNFTEANLKGANLSGANLGSTWFYNTTMPNGSICGGEEAKGCSLSK